jgi:predicted Zn-dependent protease
MRKSKSSGVMLRLVFGLAIALFSLFSYLTSSQYNEITGENQYISITPRQEIALGLQSAPSLIREFGGSYPDAEIQAAIDEIGFDLVNNSVAYGTPWQWEFTVLHSDIINAFALPGGQVFITTGLLAKLDDVDEVAAVLSHEIVHVLARHGAQRLAKNDLTNGLIGAVATASGDASASQAAAVIGQLINLQYGREDELQSDSVGVCIMISAGYDPAGMIDVQRVLEAASDGQRPPEILSSHPNPGNRIEEIEETIANASSYCP